MGFRGIGKFDNIPTVVDGIKFASGIEARRWTQLQLLERAGEITDLRRQPKYLLQLGFRSYGKWQRAITYTADFEYYMPALQHMVAEDVKGVQTQMFQIRAKLFRARYPYIELRVITEAEVGR